MTILCLAASDADGRMDGVAQSIEPEPPLPFLLKNGMPITSVGIICPRRISTAMPGSIPAFASSTVGLKDLASWCTTSLFPMPGLAQRKTGRWAWMRISISGIACAIVIVRSVSVFALAIFTVCPFLFTAIIVLKCEPKVNLPCIAPAECFT